MRKIRTIAVLPTLFTLGNLICGFFSIVVASRVAAPVGRRFADESSGLALRGPAKWRSTKTTRRTTSCSAAG